AQVIASKHRLQCEVTWTQPFRATENSSNAVDMILSAANAEGLEILLKPEPFSWGEDFGLFTEHFAGAMFGLGAGIETPALHNPDYDFPDEISAIGIGLFHRISQFVNA
ncbi:MAG: amidohydrolase, partial [Flavobacterium sp.]|nr:amidohydrolase [Flavobacterium sp.]